MKCALGNQPVRNIFIPGTHNSAAYETSPSVIEDFFYNKYVITQVKFFLESKFYSESSKSKKPFQLKNFNLQKSTIILHIF